MVEETNQLNRSTVAKQKAQQPTFRFLNERNYFVGEKQWKKESKDCWL